MLPRIPQVVVPAKVAAPPALEKTSKTVPKAITASSSPSTAAPVGINAPVLEKLSKGSKTASTGIGSSMPPNLRPSWPKEGEKKSEIRTPQLEVSKKATTATVTQPGTRVESPHGMYIVTCDVHTLGCDSVASVPGRKLIHGLFSYAEVMKWDGENITEKLIAKVKVNILESFPPFLRAGIALGTAVVVIKYPVYDITGDLVATIDIKSADDKHQYRTIHIKRFRHDMFTAFQV
jgi:hypothetical protein